MEINYKMLHSDTEGLYSLSHKEDADKLSKILKDKFGDLIIMDGTSGLGGNTLSFANYFNKIISIELNTDRYKLLKENIDMFDLNSKIVTYNDNFTNHLNDTYDLIFLDPPWGGPKYKYEKNLRLKIDDQKMYDIVKNLRELNKIIVLKLPFNYDLSEFSGFNYEIHNIKNYLIIIIH